MVNLTNGEMDYALNKVALVPGGGIKASYMVYQVIDEKPCTIGRTDTCTRDVHPHLTDLFEELRNYVAQAFYMTTFLDMVEAGDWGVPEDRKLAAHAFADSIIEQIHVNGIAWYGQGNDTSVVLTAVIEFPKGLKTTIRTPKIKLGNMLFGFEGQLSLAAESIQTEVFQYLFEGKQGQVEVFGE